MCTSSAVGSLSGADRRALHTSRPAVGVWWLPARVDLVWPLCSLKKADYLADLGLVACFGYLAVVVRPGQMISGECPTYARQEFAQALQQSASCL